MCGISLIINKDNSPVSDGVLSVFNEKIAHRGPDDDGFYYYNCIGIGHRRLAILDLSRNGHQPMAFDNKYVISFNGCVFNYLELREELKTYGYDFKTESDTEVILVAYDKWGSKCVEYFNGMWSFFILDKEKELIFASRDRFGIKPFYYLNSPQLFAACSEIKQITTLPGYQPEVNNEVAKAFLEHGHLNFTAKTFFSDVSELPAGHNLFYDLKSHSYHIHKWYNLRHIKPQHNLEFSDAKKKVRTLLDSALSIRLRADVELGAGLSGGLDSSGIVCLIDKVKKFHSSIIKTISILYRNKSINENDYVDHVIKKTKHQSIKIFPQPKDLFRDENLNRFIYHQDQPLISLSYFNEYIAFERARQENIKVFIDGHGADEIFAGYDSFFVFDLMVHAEKNRWWTFIKHAFNYLQNNFSVKEFAKVIATILLRSMVLKRLFPAQSGNSFYPDLKKLSTASYSIFMIETSSLPLQLHSYDRSTMMHSVEGRCPFLDYRLLEYAVSLPDKFKLKKGFSKYVLREALKDVIPEEVYNRKVKLGYPAPEESFMRENADHIIKLFREAIEKGNKFIPHTLPGQFLSFTKKKKRFDPIFVRYLTFIIWAKEFNVKLTQFIQATTLPASMLLSESML